MFKDFTAPAFYMGLMAAFVGFSSSFAIILAGLTKAGATDAQAATGLMFATLGMGICSIILPMLTRIPAAVAWSTPGAAFLVAAVALPGGFAEAVGAMIVCAALIVLTGLLPPLGRVVSAIPKPIANALLAGVLLKLCLAPAIALDVDPILFLPVMIAWLAGLFVNRLLAMPAALLAFVTVMILSLGPTPDPAPITQMIPAFDWVMPIFTLHGMVSVAVPLFLVTMAGQNIPGFAMLELNGYTVRRAPMIRNTGLMSLAIAPFGSVPVNMSAITAGLMAGEDAGRDPSARYWAAIVSGAVYVGLAFATGLVTHLASLAPSTLITGVAGLALVPAFVGSISGAFKDPNQLEAPALTFLITASGMTLLGVSGAFWGILAGVIIWVVKASKKTGEGKGG